ncbi:hypothetical protein ACJMK2_040392 [Sinanodonta woodiana]|uniref:LIM zinc-binding domain-containing protein n=1 Tax=Sinanodonta woodiana TaxID=1069815 RepID=A0ABD3WI94_SINWO
MDYYHSTPLYGCTPMDNALASLASMTSGTNSPSHPSSPIMHSGGGGNNNLNNNNIGGISAGGIKSCAGCGGRIIDRFLLHAVDRYWHTGCLKCSCCQTKLADFSSCFTRSGMILCKNDYLRLFGSNGSCASCGQSIPASELVMRSQGNVYHVKCFVCVTCHNQLTPGDRYGVVNGSILCEQDYPKVLKGQQTLNGRPSPKVQFSTTGIV